MPPRPLKPKDSTAPGDGSDIASPGDSKGKRKAVSSACIPCRKRKSKCDGQLPSCSTCIAVYRTECFYDPESDSRRKSAPQREGKPPPQQNAALEVIVAHLKELPERDAISLLQVLRNDGNVDSIADALRTKFALPHSFAAQALEADLSSQLSSPTATSYDAPSQRPALSRMTSREAALQRDASALGRSPATWFDSPQDAEFVEHLLNLFYCWIHPFYNFLSWEHFMQDMSHGRHAFCSKLLVNAVLSFACHYSDRPAARADPSAPHSAGDHFFAIARRLLAESDIPSLTTLQALGIMSLRETSAGRESSGYQLAGRCVRMALELGLHLSAIRRGVRQPEAEVRKILFWAVFSLETICAVSFGRLSQLPCSAADIEVSSSNSRADLQTWRPYEDTNLSISPNAEQPARPALFREQLNKLSELASDMVSTFYAPHERFTSRRLAATSARYRQWLHDLPEPFRLENTSMPHVLVLHMYYHGCMLHLFRPYIKYDLQSVDLYPRDTCSYSANEISAIMHGLRAMYGLRRVTLIVTNLLLSASTIHLLNLPSESAAQNLIQALHDLEAMSTNHHSAARAVEIIHSLSAKWNIALPKGASSAAVFGNRGADRPAHLAFLAPAGSALRRESADDQASTGNSGVDSRFPAAPMNVYNDPGALWNQHLMQHAFWTPFPGQGMPTSLGADLNLLDALPAPWSLPEWNDDPHDERSARQPSSSGTLHDEHGGMADWSWQ